MDYRRIGREGPEVSALSLGSWNTYSRMTFEAGVALVRRAFDLGIDFLDVAYYRDKPHTEVLLGRILDVVGKPREDYAIAEKVWYFDYPRQPLAEQLDESLVRLGTEYVDVIITEHPRPGMDVPAIAEELAGLVTSGRARSWGALNWSAADLRTAYDHAEAKGIPTPQLVQLKYSVARRSVVDSAEYQKLFADTGISLHASDTMEGGILAGNLDPGRKIGIDTGGIRERIKELVPRLREIAASFDASPSQLALAFCLAQPATASVLFGSTRIAQIEDNVRAVELAGERGAEIVAALAGLGVSGHENDAPYPHTERTLGEFVTV
ncbi:MULTISPECIES: aldo/keto reductase [unclassified Amycolatopsis]|uniref:aldo/keto reductase n=1 Tax=unclassified Amycolatopsis TaxID=2618356 RepID=UPI00106E48CC|nr:MULTISPECIES: aldo/keto reductase [unclassified Amycolatopsis]